MIDTSKRLGAWKQIQTLFESKAALLESPEHLSKHHAVAVSLYNCKIKLWYPKKITTEYRACKNPRLRNKDLYRETLREEQIQKKKVNGMTDDSPPSKAEMLIIFY